MKAATTRPVQKECWKSTSTLPYYHSGMRHQLSGKSVEFYELLSHPRPCIDIPSMLEWPWGTQQSIETYSICFMTICTTMQDRQPEARKASRRRELTMKAAKPHMLSELMLQHAWKGMRGSPISPHWMLFPAWTLADQVDATALIHCTCQLSNTSRDEISSPWAWTRLPGNSSMTGADLNVA